MEEVDFSLVPATTVIKYLQRKEISIFKFVTEIQPVKWPESGDLPSIERMMY